MRFITFLTFLSLVASPLLAMAHEGDTHIEVLPSSMAYQAGEEVMVTAMLNTVEAATSLRIHLVYDANSLQVKEITPNTDDFPFWWKQEGVGSLIELEASSPTPGFQGEGVVATIVFEATQSGSSEITVSNTSLVLDIEDQNILIVDEGELSSDEVPTSSGQSDPPAGQTGATAGVNLGIVIAIVIAIVIGGGIIFFVRQKK